MPRPAYLAPTYLRDMSIEEFTGLYKYAHKITSDQIRQAQISSTASTGPVPCAPRHAPRADVAVRAAGRLQKSYPAPALAPALDVDGQWPDPLC